MKKIGIFGKRVPVQVLVATILLSAVGTGIMASHFEKGAGTFYAIGEASIVQLPNRIEDNESIAVTIKAVTGNQSFQDIFRLFARNDRLVLVSVDLLNPDQIDKYFDDFVVLVRRSGTTDETVATLTLNAPSDSFVVIDPDAQNGIQYDAIIFYEANNSIIINQTVPVLIGAEVTSQ